MNKLLRMILVLNLLIISSVNSAMLGTEFTYQGELKDSANNPLTGQYDFIFTAYDTTATTGTVLGTYSANNIQVTNGVFTTTIDFGDTAFVGDQVWMEIQVAVALSGSFTALTPLQPITATPYATHAQFVGADAISDLEIQDGSITAADLGVDSVGASEISANAVGTSEINSTQVQRRVGGSCVAGDFITSVNEDGTVTCVTQNVGLTSVTSAEIVDGTIIAADVNTTQIQKRVTGSCSAGQYIKSVNQDGTVVCQADATGLTTVTSADIVDATIQTIDLGNGSVNIGKLAANSVDSSKIVDSSIKAVDVDGTQVQNRVIGQCLYPEYVTSVAENGDLICARIPVGAVFTIESGTNDVGRNTSIAIGTDNLPYIVYDDTSHSNIKLVKCTKPSCSSYETPIFLDFVGYNPSIAIAADGFPIISYYYQSNLNLKVFKCTNISCSSGSSITMDSGVDVGDYSSITIGTDSKPIISYFDGGNSTLKTLKCSNQSCSSTIGNIITTIDSGGVGLYSSIAIGADGNPIISYFDDANKDLKYVKCNNQSCSSHEVPLTLYSTGVVGLDTSIALGIDGHAVISFFDNSSLNKDLMIFKCATQLCTNAFPNTVTRIDSAGDVGSYTSIAIGSDSYPVISYHDQTNGSLKVVKCSNQSCTNYNKPITLDVPGNVGSYTSIAIGADNNPIISYYDFTNGDLKVYSCGDEACSR